MEINQDKIKIKHSSIKKDFFVFYFSEIFIKKNRYNPAVLNFDKVFNIDKSKIISLTLDDEQWKTLLYDYENFEYIKEYDFLFNYYESIKEELMSKVSIETEKYLEKYYSFLIDIFGESDLDKEIEIAFIKSPIKGARENNAKQTLDAFVFRDSKNKIYISFDSEKANSGESDFLYYIKLILHEFSHIFINNNQNLKDIINKEYTNNFEKGINKDLKENDFYGRVGELIVSSLFFPDSPPLSYKDFGFGYNVLGFQENLENKKDSLEKNKYRILCLDFLETLKNNFESTRENKLENELSVFIEKLIVSGMFKK